MLVVPARRSHAPGARRSIGFLTVALALVLEPGSAPLAQHSRASVPAMPSTMPPARTQARPAAPGPRDGEICLACGRPVGQGDAAVSYRGRRFVLHRGGCLDLWNDGPETLFARLQPRGALFQEAAEPSSPLLGGWLLFGLYVVAGLLSGAVCAYGALTKGLPPLPWFFAGLAFNVLAIGVLASRRARDLSAFPEGVLPGLTKVPATRSPGACGSCGEPHHPAARRCLACGARLAPGIEPEESRA